MDGGRDMRIAFYGRAAALGDAETALLWQRAACEATLGRGEEIVGVFFDVGPRVPLTKTKVPDGFRLERDGCLADLLGEAAQPGRRFDAVAVASADRLSRRPDIRREILRRITEAGVAIRVADQPVKSGCAPVADE